MKKLNKWTQKKSQNIFIINVLGTNFDWYISKNMFTSVSFLCIHNIYFWFPFVSSFMFQFHFALDYSTKIYYRYGLLPALFYWRCCASMILFLIINHLTQIVDFCPPHFLLQFYAKKNSFLIYKYIKCVSRYYHLIMI